MTDILSRARARALDPMVLDLPASQWGDDRSKIRIVVAMSGGVDSTVTAALLHEAGYDVVGITLQLYDHGAAIARKGACCAGDDIQDARMAAERLGFPHYVLDYEGRFSEAVMEDFADTYLAGQTPIPCVRCNQTVKFADLLRTAKDLGAAALATGHYVQRVKTPSGVHLHRAVDAAKDQSYFLFATTPEQLDFLRFPLGGLQKDEVRALAADLGLAAADKPDSQDICFVPDGNYAAVVERLRPGAVRPGDIVHIDGRVLGQHKGVIHFTVGQRRGLGVALGEPLYVVRLDAKTAQVFVGPREALLISGLSLREVNWLGDGDHTALDGLPVAVKVRSTRPPMPGQFVQDRNGALGVRLDDGDAGVAPGQACVFYSAEDENRRVLGGGWIAGTAGG
ncbi:MAG: tRNA 2-thiouridine(34) synthase MnmA [Robiginitomaculum sp.]|nr:MAG: tRNA 2-thiouridine(34) synthase MnmA [Robiginitomaculum sp.]